MKTNSLDIGKDTFVIRALSPSDFIESDLCPVTFFSIKQVQTMYEKAMAGKSKTEEELKKEYEQQLKTFKIVLKHGVVSKNGGYFDVDMYFSTETEIGKALALFNKIIEFSFLLFGKKIFELSSENAIVYDVMAKRYGCLPIDIISQSGNYSDMDAFTFNLCVASIAIEKEQQEIRRQTAAMKGRR